MKTQQTIDATCNGCGVCADLCPAHVFEIAEEGGKKRARTAPAFADGCMRCGHCAAACPSESISVEGLSPDDFFPLGKGTLGPDELQRFLESRRSVRVFKDRAVPREALERIVAMVALAPMGYTPHKLDVTVVSSRETMARALPGMVALYERMLRAWRNPLLRWGIRRELPPDELTGLRDHVIPTLPARLAGMREGRWDTITRGAPAMLLFHSLPEAGVSSVDARIAGAYALLAAHALGLGATMIDLVPPAVNRSAEVREIFEIPRGHKVHAAVVVGVPRHRFHRGIRRALPAVRWV
jgi:ferredoxin